MADQPNDDLFKDTTMTFGEHLEELRTCLARALIGIAIGFIIGLFVSKSVVEMIQKPFQSALKDFYSDEAETQYQVWLQEKRDAGLNVPDDTERVRYMVTEQQMLFDEIHIEPWELEASLRKVFPGQLGASQWIGAGKFEKADFLKPAELCKAVAAGNDAETAAGRIWSRLAKPQQKAIAAANSDEQAATALLALNNLLDDATLYDEKAFATIAVFGQARELLSRAENLTPAEQQRLDRLLIEAVYRPTGFLRQTQPQLVTMFAWHPLDADDRIKLTSLNAQEAFMIFIKAGLITGLFLSSPWIFYQIWAFVAAGLYPHEKRYIHVFLPISLTLFFSGASLAFFLVMEIVLGFLLGFNQRLGIDPDPRISEWLSFVLFLPLGFGISFQLPLVMLFLERIGVFTVEAYTEKWRIAVLVISVIAMLLTPADPASMLLMAIPLWLLYALGILLCKYMPKSRSPFDEPAEMAAAQP